MFRFISQDNLCDYSPQSDLCSLLRSLLGSCPSVRWNKRHLPNCCIKQAQVSVIYAKWGTLASFKPTPQYNLYAWKSVTEYSDAVHRPKRGFGNVSHRTVRVLHSRWLMTYIQVPARQQIWQWRTSSKWADGCDKNGTWTTWQEIEQQFRRSVLNNYCYSISEFIKSNAFFWNVVYNT
jgi:hypothetical protein